MNKSYEMLRKTLSKDDIVVIGCSGGPDSMAALVILMNLRKELNLKLICAHVNHNIRKASKREAEFLKQYCLENNIIFEYMVINSYGDDNFHNEARSIRYAFFEDVVKKYSAKYLVTAHHGDDLMETILMRLVRGSTLQGYAGFNMIVSKKTYKIIRPLIYYTKAEILDFDIKNNIKYVVDKSNKSSKYTRNRYRKYVLPFLKNEDSKVHEKFLKYSLMINSANQYIREETIKLKKRLFLDNKLNIDEFKKIDDFFKDSVLNIILEEVYPEDLFLISDSHTNLIKTLINSNKSNGYVILPHDIRVVKSYNNLYIDKENNDEPKYNIEIDNYVKLPNGKSVEVVDNGDINDNNYCRLNIKDVLLPLRIRTRESGDNMYVKGMSGRQKVKDIFINKKIPPEDRKLWPVVVDSNNIIVWIPGIKKSKFDIPKNENCDIILKYY